MDSRVALAFQRFDRAELKFCRYLNRPNGYVVIRYVFRGVSWLGDGWFWYALIAALPLLYGAERSLHGAHVAIEHRHADAGVLKQHLHVVQEDGIVGRYQIAHG